MLEFTQIYNHLKIKKNLMQKILSRTLLLLLLSTTFLNPTTDGIVIKEGPAPNPISMIELHPQAEDLE